MSAAALLLGLALSTGAGDADADARHQVRVVRVDGDLRCSLFAERAPLRDVLGDLARECGVVVEGLEHVSRTALVDAELRDRPVRQALEFVLGSVGLRVEARADAWRLTEALGPAQTAERLREEAMGALQDALRDFPEHPAAAEGLLALGRLERELGDATAAGETFDALVERFPRSSQAADALLESGLALLALRRFEDAADRFTDLLRLDTQHAHERRARLELARCSVGRGDARAALVQLDTLEAADPARSDAQRLERGLLRARALVESGNLHEGLQRLDALDGLAPRGHDEIESLELRARALDGLGRPADAARAWLAFAQGSAGSERTIGLRHAARLALEAGEEVAVLFIARMAEEGRPSEELDELVREARTRLALANPPAEATPGERLERGEELVQSGRFAEARDALAVLGLSRVHLDAGELGRFALAYGRALIQTDGVDEAAGVLRGLLPELEDARARRDVYLLLGDAFDAAGRTDEAVSAWQGRL